MRLGDYANVFALVNTGAFLVFVLAADRGLVGDSDISPSFKKAGFCIFAPHTLNNSHIILRSTRNMGR
jgi:hypothetical protein